MKKALTVREKMGLNGFNPDTFDPMNIEASELKNLYESMPRDGSVDLYMAEKLAIQYLRAADRCSEILGILSLWEQTAKDRKRQTYSLAFLNAKNSGNKMTDTTAKHMAECDDTYLKSCKMLREAEVVRRRFVDMQEIFIKGHHLMKDRMKDEQKLRQVSNYEYGEGSWDK